MAREVNNSAVVMMIDGMEDRSKKAAALQVLASPALRAEIRAIQSLERKLAQLGYVRGMGETPGDFIARVICSEPRWQASLSIIARLFEQIAYRQQTQQLAQLQEKVRRFPAL